MKQQILSDITGKLPVLGITVNTGNGTDISLSAEFVNAGWSTGKKKISYEAAVFADEREKTVYMFEKTTEVGQGFSFGGGSESSFQSGKTLFRKVKSIQYGPEGKVFEVELDLGAIPKTVRDASDRYGWKFKTVLNKKKAMYPEGYIAAASAPFDARPADSAPAVFCTNCGTRLAGDSRFCVNCGRPLAP